MIQFFIYWACFSSKHQRFSKGNKWMSLWKRWMTISFDVISLNFISHIGIPKWNFARHLIEISRMKQFSKHEMRKVLNLSVVHYVEALPPQFYEKFRIRCSIKINFKWPWLSWFRREWQNFYTIINNWWVALERKMVTGVEN